MGIYSPNTTIRICKPIDDTIEKNPEDGYNVYDFAKEISGTVGNLLLLNDTLVTSLVNLEVCADVEPFKYAIFVPILRIVIGPAFVSTPVAHISSAVNVTSAVVITSAV